MKDLRDLTDWTIDDVTPDHQPTEALQITFCNFLHLHHKSPASGERQYKSGTCKGDSILLLTWGGEHSAYVKPRPTHTLFEV